jgi:hypothetical protein
MAHRGPITRTLSIQIVILDVAGSSPARPTARKARTYVVLVPPRQIASGRFCALTPPRSHGVKVTTSTQQTRSSSQQI